MTMATMCHMEVMELLRSKKWISGSPSRFSVKKAGQITSLTPSPSRASSKDAGNKATAIMQVENPQDYHRLVDALLGNPR